MKGDQHTDHISSGQQVSRHLLPTQSFLFFPLPQFLKTILASHTSGTFGFAPTHKADPSAKPKEPLFGQRLTIISDIHDIKF